MKKIRNIILTTFIFCLLSCSAAMAADWSIQVNGQKLDAEVKIIDGRSLVPLRAVGEALGLKVDWYSSTQLIWLEDKNNEYAAYATLRIPENRFEASISDSIGKKYGVHVYGDWKMYVKPVNINGRVYVPVRLVASTFGAPVDVKNNVISIGQKYTDAGYSVKNISNLIYSENSVLEIPAEANQPATTTTTSSNTNTAPEYRTVDGGIIYSLNNGIELAFIEDTIPAGKNVGKAKAQKIYNEAVKTIKGQLKDPITARFDSQVGEDIVVITPAYGGYRGGKYSVVGQVYAANSFGAYSLSNYVVDFDSNWNVTGWYMD